MDIDALAAANGVLLLRNAFADGPALILAVEESGEWVPSGITGNDRAQYEGLEQASIVGPLLTFDRVIYEAAVAGLRAYQERFGAVSITHDCGYKVLRYRQGDGLKPHVDAPADGRTPMSARKLSLLIYLNDDYGGGELHFLTRSLTYKPEAGSLVIFPSGPSYPHEARPVALGVKYAINSWFY